MIIINSGAYIIPELQAEYGKIPPCMLPLGNRRLLQHQVTAIREKFQLARIVLSLPESYKLTINDGLLLKQTGANVVRVPDVFSLAESVLYVLNTQDEDPADPVIRLMHGDTLITDIPDTNDTIGISKTTDDYGWELESKDDSEELVWCGLFTFSSVRLLIQSLTLARGNFIEAIRRYSAKCPLSSSHIKQWHDLGHVNTYFKSRSSITTQRSFNSLHIENGIVYKTGHPNKKIEAEAQWFLNIPPRIKKYTPQLIDMGKDDAGLSFYCLEFLSLAPLNEIFVHGRNPPFYWRKVFDLFGNLLGEFSFSDVGQVKKLSNLTAETETLYKEKTYRRLAEFGECNFYDIHKPTHYADQDVPSLMDLATICIERTLALPVVPSILHGDLCFSNILYDSRSEAIKVIDPRGISESGELSIFGDQKYDVAKLAHSVLGLYDWIIAGRYELHVNENNMVLDFHLDERILAIQNTFEKKSFMPNITVRELMPAVVLLFISMLPLHADRADRQKAMVANAYRIYLKYCTMEHLS
ncbi:hypothetical protein [Pseudomonas fluorescens]|uniref:Capsular biosynthesis protein n=1 Tax=Pseudomonas fluorescens TaxID=294 RepID=A0A5E7DDQ1_PSEFL|nr:hypothetical protein [Pseudomonas fluorescens]VVO11948.1 hypothetical protein PS691_03477 [Pseudomonas fluorescens]